MKTALAYIFCATILLSTVSAQKQPVHLVIAPLDTSPTIAEVPVHIFTTLVDSAGAPIVGAPITFDRDPIYYPEIATLTVSTDSVGMAHTLYLPPRTASDENRIAFLGNDNFLPADTTLVFSIEPRPGTFQNLKDFPHTDADGIPLILVHGRSGEGDFMRWNVLLDHVTKNPDQFSEFDIYVWDHDTRKPIGFDGFTGSAQDLYESLSELSELYSHFTPVFVAHSRGGLVVRSLMSREEPDGTRYGDRVLGLITLGTPHHGSPLAVVDWARAIWHEAWNDVVGADLMFDFLVGWEGLLFETDLIGDMNLTWDNYDNAVSPNGYRSKALGSDHPERVDVSISDLNTHESDTNDLTVSIDPGVKATFGTLDQLNTPDSSGSITYADQIVTIGAYRAESSNFAQNLISAVQIVLSLPVSTDVREWLEVQLDEGDRDHNLLNIGNRLLAHTVSDLFADGPDINYDANDGLVPLQSALLLAASADNISEPSPTRQIDVNRDRITALKQVKAQHIFSSAHGIEDHLDLLTTDNELYWNTITQELRQFLPGAPDACAPDLDNNAFIDFADFLIFARMFSDQDPQADFNIDGTTDFNDFLIFASKFGQPCP
jgi:triacylglycerol esterase/lipase EstA (alpha/beta hydrolase family)